MTGQKKHFLLKVAFAFVIQVFAAHSEAQIVTNNSGPLWVEEGLIHRHLRLHQLTSKVFGNTRSIRVLLPSGYDDAINKKRKYPVLYLNDGQNLFDVSTSIFNPMEWQADETVRRLIEKKEIEPLIVVGIDNAGRTGRANEYLPYGDKYLSPPLPDPQGKKYHIFLAEEVMPLVEQHYRVGRGPRYTGLGGSSYGALISLHSVLKRPGVFGYLLLESPSLYVADTAVLNEAQKVRNFPQKVYIGVGTNEEGRSECTPGDINKEAVQDVLKLEKILKGTVDKRRLKVVVADCAVHNENAWAKRLPEALTFLFKRN